MVWMFCNRILCTASVLEDIVLITLVSFDFFLVFFVLNETRLILFHPESRPLFVLFIKHILCLKKAEGTIPWAMTFSFSRRSAEEVTACTTKNSVHFGV